MRYARQVAGEDTPELYKLSAAILPVLMTMNQNDPAKAQAALSEFSRNPASFLQGMPPELQMQIKDLARKIEQKNQ